MNLLILPVLVPFLAAVACLLCGRRVALQQALSGFAAHALLGVAAALLWAMRDGAILALPVGGWPGTFGIVFAADLLSGIMVALSALMMVVTWWFVVLGAMPGHQQSRHFHALFCLLATSVNWAFCTADLFNLFVSFELMLLASYALLAHDNDRDGLRETTKFVVINVIGGMLFLAAAGLAYGAFGSLNFADLALRIRQTPQLGLATALGTLLLVVFGMKAAIFPLFFWLPNAYPRAPLGIMPFFTGMLTKVGVYVLYRVFTLIFQVEWDRWFQPVLLGIASATMFLGVLAALGQWTIRRILSIHIISQIGYMIMGLGIMTTMSLAGGIFAIIHNVVVKTSLFLVAGVVLAAWGTDRLKELGGLLDRSGLLAALFLLAAFSLAGLPPLSGFFPKYALVLEGFRHGHTFVTVVSIVTSLFTLSSMVKIWQYAFMGEPPADAPPPAPASRHLVIVAAGLVVVMALLTLFSRPLFTLCERAAAQLVSPQPYIDAVVGRGPDWSPPPSLPPRPGPPQP